jgi:hypothetical protein
MCVVYENLLKPRQSFRITLYWIRYIINYRNMLRIYVPIQSYIHSGHHTENFCEFRGSHSSASVDLHLP